MPEKEIRGSTIEPLGEFHESSDRWYEGWWSRSSMPAVVVFRPRWRRVWGWRVFYGKIGIPVHEVRPSLKSRGDAELAARGFVAGMDPTQYVVGHIYS